MQRTAVVIGATGLTGSNLVKLLLAEDYYSTVRTITRRPIEIFHPRLEEHVIDFSNQEALRNAIGNGDDMFSCIGTTYGKVKGDRKVYREIDFGIAVNAGKYARENGFRQYLLVSAIGANSASANFYVRLKGDVENAIIALEFPALHIFRPAIVYGERKESRLLEKSARALMQAFSFLMLGKYARFKPIPGASVAVAMKEAAKLERKGIHWYHYPEMISLQ